MKILDWIIRPCGGVSHTRPIAKRVSRYLNTNEKILDFGAGDCRIAECLIEKYQLNVTTVDVIDYNKTKLKLILYDGKKLPFGDKDFDAVLAVFVFHHIDKEKQEDAFKELIRVFKSKIIIIEDTPKNRAEKIFWKMWDWLLNLGHGTKMTYSARTTDGWEKLFSKLSLKIKTQENFRPWQPALGMFQQTMFVLEKKNG